MTHPETCDLSNAETPQEAAEMLYAYLVSECADNPSEVVLDDPDSAAAKNGGSAAWTVTWEGGPHRWGVHATLNRGVYNTENPSLKNVANIDGILAEPYYSFNVQFEEF